MRQSQEESCDYGSSDEDFLGLEGTVGYPSAKLRRVRAIFLGTHRRRRSVLPSQGNQPRVVVSTTTCRNPKATYTDLTSSEDEDAACDRLVDDQDVGLCTTRLKKLCAKAVAPLDLHQLTEKSDHQVSLEDLRDLKQVEEAALTAKVLQLQMRMAKQLAALEASFRSNVAEMTRQLVTAIESERAQLYYQPRLSELCKSGCFVRLERSRLDATRVGELSCLLPSRSS
ncbi:hypothetical protein AaE_009722 [Aphanomyces astaci]|uniref:Uncharacterized protein n=1 Tax=Aphanomyces astaci TaxID=112090 RepID=A0A6A5A493_APHAT|nr:hypothetical protein AaE_009722 [Aphanomyces astaci]